MAATSFQVPTSVPTTYYCLANHLKPQTTILICPWSLWSAIQTRDSSCLLSPSLEALLGIPEWLGLESFGGFFIHISGTLCEMTQRLGSAGTVNGSLCTWFLHVAWLPHSWMVTGQSDFLQGGSGPQGQMFPTNTAKAAWPLRT